VSAPARRVNFGAAQSRYCHHPNAGRTPSNVWAVAITADGQLAVSASQDKTLKVWELKTDRVLRTLEGHSAYVMGVAMTANLHLAVSASRDKTGSVRRWEERRRSGKPAVHVRYTV
jgi:WD40 repeat protein